MAKLITPALLPVITYDNVNLKLGVGACRDYIVEVTHYTYQAGNPAADNPDDFYGYTECEYNIIKITYFYDDGSVMWNKKK